MATMKKEMAAKLDQAIASVLLTCGPWMTARDIGRHLRCDGGAVKDRLEGMKARRTVDARTVSVPGTDDRFVMWRAMPAIVGELCGATARGGVA